MATYLREDEVFGAKKPVQYLSDAEVFGKTPPATPPVAAVAPERPALEPMAGTMAGFELPEPAEPTPVAPVAAPEKPSPYKSRIEALDDAVNFIEEGADQKQVFDAFKQLGLTQEEIIRHGQKRGSEFFQVQPAGPGVPSVEPTGRMTSFEPGVLQQSADYFKRAKTSLSDQATSFMLSTGAIIPDNILDTYVNTKKAQGDTRPDSVIRDEARADAAANLIRRNARDRAAAAPNESIQRGMEEIGSAETYGDAAKAMLRNPGTTLSMLVESLLVTTPSLAATLVLAPAGVPARAATAFVSSGAMEYASVMNDVLQDKGVDLTNAEQVSKALRDPKILEEMKEKGAKRGLIVGGFDAISMGLAGRFLRPANELIAAGKLTGQAARNATISAWSKELAMQMALGAGGEFAAQQATGDNRPADVILEGLAEGLTAPLDVRATLRQAQAITPEAQIARAIEAGVAETEFTPEGIRREGAAAAAGLRPTTIAEIAASMPEIPSAADLAPSPGEPSFGDLAPAPGRAEPSLGAATVVGGRQEPRLGPPPEPPAPTTPVVEPTVTPVTTKPAVTPVTAPVTPVTTKPAVTPVTTRTVPTIPGMPTGEEIDEEPVTPVTAPVTPVTGGEPVKVASFTTEKGSTYEVTPEGQTIRTKRSPGRGQGTTYEPHTVLYVTPDNLIDIQSDLSSGMGDNAVRLGYVADNKFMPAITPADIPEGAKTVVGVFNRDSNAVVGIYPAVNTPEVGLHPIEKLYMPDGKSSTHLGNKIVEITPVTPVTKGDFKPTQAAARLPDIPTVAPLVAPKTFEPPPVGLEASGVPTVEVPLGDLRLSNDVPQFKLGATAEGIVEPLGGKFERVGVAPIQVWRRLDGSLEVISGRHRFDLAKRSGETTIPAQIHDEAKGFNRLQASILDAELNIRDGQGKVKDYVNYFKESGITKQDADARGLLARATGKRSFTIATQGSDELIAAVRADQIGDEAAFYIALNAPNDARLQGVGIKAIQDGKSMNTATNMMQAVKALAGETDTTLDMFGFDDSAIREAEEMAKIAAQKQREIQTRLSAISGAAKNPALAKAEGIDVRDPEAIKRRIEELKQRKAAWDNWSTSPDLVAEIRAARGVAPPAPTIVEEPPAGPSLFDEDLLTAPTPEDIRAKEEAAAKRAQEAAEAERKAKADEARGDFVLTGSDRAADEAAARGQMELGAQPEPGTTVDENDPGFRGASDEEVKDVADAFKNAAERQDADKVTRVLDAPNKGEIVRIENKAKIFVKDAGYLTVAQAKQRIAEWKNNAQSQGEDRRNSEKIVLSLFDMTGEWSKPWEEAGYQVYRFDIQTDPEFGDVNKFSSEFFNDMYGAFEGQDVYAILAACPCTDFASSGARHFAAKDADGRTVESVELVQQTLATIEYFKPSVWAIENPVGRIEKLTGLPPWRMSFNPNHFGDPYTKKTLLWGRFNADLPIAPVEPTEGSKMHRMYGGKSQETKNARSVTPEGFAYAFFQANNAIDNPVMAIANKYDMMDPGVIRKAIAAGMSGNQISDIVDDPYYFYQDYRAANKALMDAVAELDVAPAAPAAKEPENIRLARKELKESEREPGKELTPAQLKRRRELIEYEKAQGVTGVTADTVVNNQAPPADLPAENRLVLMPCCAKKGDKKAPAMELYKGVFFQSFASNVKPGAQPNVIILSAKHGFIDPTQEIEPYDQVMTPTRAKEMLDNMGAELAKVTWPTNIQDVLVVGGKEYQQVMRAALADLVNSGQIPKTASINVTSGGIGEQRQQLNSYLQAIPAVEPTESDVVNKYTSLLDDQQQVVQYEDSERGQVKTETAEWQGTISRAEFDELSKLATATPMKRGQKYSIQLVDTPEESSVLTMTTRGLTPTQRQVEVAMVRQVSTLTGRGIPLENIPPKQMGFGFEDTEATDFIARNNPVVAETLSKADQLPGAKKKLPPGRSPELAEAARQLKAGQITAAEFDALVNRYRPIAVYTEPLKPASDKQMYDALDVAKRGKINPSISDGYPVGLRLDIPAFNRAGVYVVTIHEKRTPSSPGKAIGYTSVAAVRNATFGVGNQQAALRIATGEAKDALQTIEGLYTPITPEEAYRRAEEALKSKDWVQVGIDPIRHSYFYDRKTTQPVLKADEIIQIGNMVLAKGVTYGNKSDFLFSPEIDRAEAEGLAVGTTREEQIKEYSALRRRLAGVVKKVVEGKVDIDVQRNTTDMMQRSRELQAAIKASKPRIDTPEAFLAKALQEYDKGNIEKDVLDVVQAAYSKQPELLNGLLLSVRKEQGEAAGRFDPFRRVVFLFKQTSGVYAPATIRHELAHSLEQMMTPEQRVAVVQAWGKALARAIKQNPDKLHQRYFNAVLDFLENPSVRSFRKAQSLLPSYEMYQFINPSEYWAVNAEKLMAAQLGTAWDRFKKAVRQLFEGLKKVLGFDNRYEVHKVFSQVMGGSKERLNRESLVDLVTDTDGSAFVTLNNIEDADKILKKYNRPNTPQNDTTPLATFVNQQFKRGKEAFSDMVENPKEATVGAYNYVSDGLTKFRIENIFFGAGLEKRDFERYGGQLRTSDKLITASVALDNAIRGGNIAVEVISRGGIEYNDKFGNFVAVKTDMGMAGVYRAEKKLKDDLGDQRGTDIINGYFEAKRSISIVDEFNERSKQLAAATNNYNVLKAAGGDPDAVAQAKAAMDAAREDVESIKKAVSSVTMSEEEMYEFAALEDTYPELRDMMDNWTAINQNLLRMWRQVGLLSQGRYETLSAIKDYVPWYRIMDDAADVHDPVQSTTRTFVNIGREKLFKRGKPVARFDMRATAGQKEFNVPASSVVKIKVNDKAVDPKKVLLSPDGKIILDVDLQENDLVTFETVREIQNIVDNMTRNVMRMTMNGLRQFAQNRIVLEYATRNAKDKIQTYSTVDPALNRFNWTSNGKKVVVEIADPLVAAAVYGLEPVNFGKALGAMFKASEMAANILRRSITLSGAFQVKQVFKDAPTAAIVTGVRNPFALIGGVWKGFLTSLTNTDPVVDILKSAGIGGYMSPARTPEAELKRRMGIINRNVFSFVIKGLDHIGDSADMAQRVAVYKRVLAETGDQGQALYQAANVINYLRRGKAGYAQAIVKLTPFMGAYANATDVLLQTLMLRGLKGQTRAKLAGRLLATTGALSVVTLLYAMLAGADPEYDEVDDQTKLRNIFIPGTEIMLPMNTSAAYIFKVMPELLYMNLIRQSTESKMDERRLRRALGEAAKDMLLGPEPVPAGLKPVLEVGINRSFYTGRDIVPENMQKLEPFMQFTASTSELAKKLGEYTNMSPMNIDHLVRGLFGSVGAMAQWASNSMAVAVGDRPEPTRREAPVVGGFLRPELPRGREDLYYDFKKDILEKYTTYDRMLKQENFDEADKYFNKHAKLIEMYDYINEIDEGLQEVNQEIQRIALSKAKDLTPKERRSEITELQKIKRDVVDSVLDFRKDVYGLSSLVRQPAE